MALHWKELGENTSLDTLLKLSRKVPCIVFKHSTRCIISIRVLDGFQDLWDARLNDFHVEFFYLDLLAFRQLSNAIAARLNVPHQSPQVLLIINETCTLHASHSEILSESFNDNIVSQLSVK